MKKSLLFSENYEIAASSSAQKYRWESRSSSKRNRRKLTAEGEKWSAVPWYWQCSVNTALGRCGYFNKNHSWKLQPSRTYGCTGKIHENGRASRRVRIISTHRARVSFEATLFHEFTCIEHFWLLRKCIAPTIPHQI